MIEVRPNLFVGGGTDYEAVRDKPGWNVLTCAKEPWHREALGYTGRSAPKTSEEYLLAYRGPHRLILDMVDAPQFMFFNPEMIEAGIRFIRLSLEADDEQTLVHCNQGNSRAPAMALLYMRRYGWITPEYEAALEEFKAIYPDYAPGKGIDDYVRREFAQGAPIRHEPPSTLEVAS